MSGIEIQITLDHITEQGPSYILNFLYCYPKFECIATQISLPVNDQSASTYNSQSHGSTPLTQLTIIAMVTPPTTIQTILIIQLMVSPFTQPLLTPNNTIVPFKHSLPLSIRTPMHASIPLQSSMGTIQSGHSLNTQLVLGHLISTYSSLVGMHLQPSTCIQLSISL